MPVRMKALRSFRGEPGEGNAGDHRMVEAGGEFSVLSMDRVAELERIGHAFKVPPVAPEAALKPKETIENKAAQAGPLDSAGGETGAESAPSSSDPAPRRRGSRSKKGEGGLDF